jgi:hypothetical protein
MLEKTSHISCCHSMSSGRANYQLEGGSDDFKSTHLTTKSQRRRKNIWRLFLPHDGDECIWCQWRHDDDECIMMLIEQQGFGNCIGSQWRWPFEWCGSRSLLDDVETTVYPWESTLFCNWFWCGLLISLRNRPLGHARQFLSAAASVSFVVMYVYSFWNISFYFRNKACHTFIMRFRCILTKRLNHRRKRGRVLL